MQTLHTNIAFIVAFTALILFKITFAIFGWKSLIFSIVIIAAVFYGVKRLIRKTGSLVDLPSLWPYKRPAIGRKIIAERIVINNAINDVNSTSNNRRNSNQWASSTVCLICNENDCPKHSKDLQIHRKPWKNILLETNVNSELETFISTILDDNTGFLKELSHNNDEILDEIRQLIRLLLSSLIYRFYQSFDIGDFLVKKLPRMFFHHFEAYLNGKRKAKNARCLEEIALQNYGTFLHPGIHSADSEVKFYKFLSGLLLETTLPKSVLNCDVSSTFLNEFLSSSLISPLVDILTDPDKINTFLIVLLDKESIVKVDELKDKRGQMVEILNGFSPNVKLSKSSYLLGVEQKELLEEQNLLFLFQQYAKEEEFLNIVQFIINMKGFLAEITNPEISAFDLKSICQKLNYIYELFFDEGSDQFIEFDESIKQFFTRIVAKSRKFRESINDSSIEEFKSEVPKLQSSKELYEAFDYANNILDYHINKFYHTDIYLKLVCGQRSSRGFNFDSNIEVKLSNDDSEDGQGENGEFDRFDDRDNPMDRETNDFGPDSLAFLGNGSLNRNLNLMDYVISIPDVNSRFHSLDGEVFLFVIQIKDQKRSWIIERQLQDFYGLLSKLRLFHGDQTLSSIPSLPSRKPFQQCNRILMESFRLDLEHFLQALLRHKALQRSELIYNFLSVDFQQLESDNFNLGRMIKNVPSKFTKERGQHLQTFIKNFISSCEEIPENSKPKERSECGAKSRIKALDSLNLSFDLNLLPNISDRSSVQIEYLYDFLLLLILRFYRIGKNWILELLLMLRPLVRKTFQSFVEFQLFTYLENEIFTPEKVCHYIRSFRILYREETDSESDKNSESEKNSMKSILELSKSQRSQKALEMAKAFVPKWVVDHITDMEKHEEVVFLLFSLLQYRSLNKQLLFLIMNSIVSDLFPEPLIRQTMNRSLDK